MRKVARTRVGGQEIALSNLDKNLYPQFGFTKAQVLEYYNKMAPYILPHLKGRALTLKRFPDGVDSEHFFEKRCPAYRPSWVKTAQVKQKSGVEMTVCLVNDLNTLIWVENLASLELHVPLAKTATPDNADFIVFDLDPGEGADIFDCARVALVIRDLLSDMKLESRLKTSGMKGLHVLVPLNNGKTTFDDTKKFSKAIAELMQKNYPETVTARMAKELRKNKVFINWSQNDPTKTMVCVYSLRAADKPYVSFPLAWPEIQNLKGREHPEKLHILYSEALQKTEKNGDLIADVLVKKQNLPAS